MAGGLNLYGYANGDPVNLSDPFGLCPWCAAALAGAAFEGGLRLASNAFAGRDLLDGVGRAAAVGAVSGLAGFGAGKLVGRLAASSRGSGVLQKIFEFRRGKGNFGLGASSADEAFDLGRSFVGPDAVDIVKNGRVIGSRSEDGLRQFRFPSQKANGRIQANLEEFTINDLGKKTQIRNGHIDINRE